MTYVAFLRGINVGGKNTVSMAALKQLCTDAGLQNVSTYINSGNIIFESNLSKPEASQIIQKFLAATYDFEIMTIVLTGDELKAIAQTLPASWVNDTSMKCDVMFLHESIDTPNIVQQFTIKPGIDKVKYVEHAILWAVERKSITKSGLLKIVGTPIYKQMTIRNCNTVRKLTERIAAP